MPSKGRFVVSDRRYASEEGAYATEGAAFRSFPKALSHAAERSLSLKGRTFIVERCTLDARASKLAREMGENEKCVLAAVVNAKRR